MALSRQEKKFIETFVRNGSGAAMVEISYKALVLLVHIAYHDLCEDRPEWFLEDYSETINSGFYSIDYDNVERLSDVSPEQVFEIMTKSGATNASNIIYLYLMNLCTLYRKRYKFNGILASQGFPSFEQIGLRCLLEYGYCDNALLSSWMMWRKLIYDIDNRSAQETGYLFESIVASCLGGKSVSHAASPVKRIDGGRQTAEGRQVDCYLEETGEVFELKLRVTIAASGQGRFREEMTFPYEARVAGLTPVLIVFDGTPSPLLEKLADAYRNENGKVYVGEEAWKHLEEKAGREMGLFIEKYIYPPIKTMEEEFQRSPLSKGPSTITLSVGEQEISISSETKEYRIHRE